MALVVKDRVLETTTTTGTGTYTLGGTLTGYQSFSVIGDANTTYYVVTDGVGWEVGIGTYTSSGTTLARTTILASSNSNNAVNWGAGTKTVFVTYPADKAVMTDATQTLTSKTIQAGTFTNTSLFSGTMSSTANAYQEIDALADGATITPDFSTGNNFSVTLGGNRTLANPTNLTAGQSGVIFITQDGTGGRTLAYGSYWDFPNASAPTLTTTANAVDVLVYSVRSSTSIAAQLITNIG